MMKTIVCSLFLVMTLNFAFGQTDPIGSGRCINFDGTDDYVNLGNIYDDLVLPVTLEAWIFLNEAAGYAYPIFNSQDNLPLYNGVTFLVSATNMSIQYGDGRGENNGAFRRGVLASFPDITGRWVHVAAVMRSATDMDLYLNGVKLAGQYQGTSDQPMASNSPDDVAKIGYWHSNGQTYYFKGRMDELRLWRVSRPQSDIRNNMCKKLTGTETGLIGYWSFDETGGSAVLDKSNNIFDGSLNGNASRTFSGAPIGDSSMQLYENNWSGVSVVYSVGDDEQIVAENVKGNPNGVHIYEVVGSPSQTNGLNLSEVGETYFGVFAASLLDDSYFDIQYNQRNADVCEIFSRSNNSVPLWTKTVSLKNFHRQTEIIKNAGTDVPDIDLPNEIVVCDKSSQILSTGITDPGITIIWSNGENTPSIDVNYAGSYWVKLGSCNSNIDTVSVIFSTTPLSFSLGEDASFCELPQLTLTASPGTGDFTFVWQDGSTEGTFKPTDFGTFWVKAKSACGVVTDTITISKQSVSPAELPNVITPNGDNWNEFFETPLEGEIRLKVFNRWGLLVYSTDHYVNDWSGSDLPSGIYFYQLSSACLSECRGFLSIIK